jgi:hypothetical protein
VETVRLAVEAGQVVSRSKQFKVIQASNHREASHRRDPVFRQSGKPNHAAGL